MSTLKQFVASVKTQGLMTKSRFRVEFNLPPALVKENQSRDLRKILMYCEGLTLPSVSLSTQQARTYGEFREMPYERLYQNIALTFFVDNTMDSKVLFDDWINSIQNPSTRQFSYYNEYITDITIKVLDVNDKERYEVKLFECYPLSINQIDMDYGSKDVMRLTVNMNYRYWTSSTEGASKSTPSAPSPGFSLPRLNLPGLNK